MNDYLQQFKNSLFSGSISLYKRVLVPFIILSIIFSLITSISVLPIMAKGQGLSLSKMHSENQQRMEKIIESIKNKEDIKDVFKSSMGEINYGFILLGIVLALLVSSWQSYLLFKVNDSEVRNSENSFLTALKNSFSRKIFTLLLANILLGLLIFIGFLIWVLLIVVLMSISVPLGILIAFISIFFVTALFLRFLLVLPALIHGNMSIGESIAYSWKNINLKRAFLLLLAGIVFLIIIVIVMGIFTLIFSKIIPKGDSFILVILNQIFQGIIGAVLSAFIYSSLSALYFHFNNEYSNDEESIQTHLINE